jgi:hypothetical protein
LDEFGCFDGPRIKLQSREITKKSILRLVQAHNQRIVQAMLRAIEILREDSAGDPDDDLLEAVLLLEQLQPVFKPWSHLKSKDKRAL